MARTDPIVTVTDAPSPEVKAFLGEGLNEHNRDQAGHWDQRPLAVLVCGIMEQTHPNQMVEIPCAQTEKTEVTAEMISAGVSELANYDMRDGEWGVIVENVFREMIRLRKSEDGY